MSKRFRLGIVGATGMVGKTFLGMLEERDWRIEELRLFASEASSGKKMSCLGRDWPVQPLSEGCFKDLDLVFFSSGDDISKEWGPKAVAQGAWAVDNSAAFRMDQSTVLMVPEVNGDLLEGLKKPALIANPNCSTIQLVVALSPLLKKFGIESVQVASYQSVSGAGQPGYDELLRQTENLKTEPEPKPQTFPHVIAYNCIPQIGSFDSKGFCSEETKIIQETKKILRSPEIRVSAFTVRVPTLNSHAEAVWVTLKKETSREELIRTLEEAPGVIVQDRPAESLYPLQRQASGEDPVFVGRVHQDLDQPRMWLMWVVSDNLRKGAALNGIQIAERIFDIA